MDVLIRRAAPSDAAAACDIVRRSIVELCIADHRLDEPTISQWLANKTVENIGGWIGSADHIALVAEREHAIVGFGLLNRSGKLALLYVAPTARLAGISKALLATLEQEAMDAEIKEISLESSVTARRFYQRCGYVSAGDPVAGFGVTKGYPMTKRIAP